MLRLNPVVLANLFFGAPLDPETYPRAVAEIFGWSAPDPSARAVEALREDRWTASTQLVASAADHLPPNATPVLITGQEAADRGGEETI